MRRQSVSGRATAGLIAVLIALVLFALGRTGNLGPLASAVSVVLTPLQAFVAEQVGGLVASPPEDAGLEELRARNTELEAQITQLQAEIVQLREAEAERAVLAALLDFARQNPENTYTAADIIGHDPSPFLRFLILDKGTTDGIVRDMPVVADNGLVGIITEVTPTASKVLLITDPRMAVNVRLQTSRAEGVVAGAETGDLRLQYVSLDAEVNPGDLVLTSGLGGTFPQDLLVGTVASVRKRSFDVFQEADVQTFVDFTRLEIVLIITDFRPQDLDPLLGTPAPEAP